MKNAEAWVKLLYTYGPFAILVLLIFVTERRSRTAMNQAAENQKKLLSIYIGVYVVNWVAIIATLIFSVYAWKQINLDRKPQISGTFENIPDSEVVTTSFDDLYLHRIRENNYSNYEWLLVNKDKLGDGETIVFTIERNGPGEYIYDYDLPIRSDFYDRKLHLRREQDDLYFVGQDKPLLKRKKDIGAPQRTAKVEHPWDFLTTTAYAQTDTRSFSTYDFGVGLESPDAIIRRQARADLASQDQATALPWIDDVLKDQKSSYRIRLGVIVALNNMPNLEAGSLRPATVAAIQGALNASDDTLRNEALSLAKRYKLIPVIVYENFDYSGRSQAFGPGRYRANEGQLGNLPNDSASSLRVAKGFKVRICESEGTGNGSGLCEEKGAGSYQLNWAPSGSLADNVSFIHVIPLN